MEWWTMAETRRVIYRPYVSRSLALTVAHDHGHDQHWPNKALHLRISAPAYEKKSMSTVPHGLFGRW